MDEIVEGVDLEDKMKCDESMVVDHTSRLMRIDTVLEIHTESLKALKDLSEEFKKMKYTMYGVVGLYLVQTIGIADALRALL